MFRKLIFICLILTGFTHFVLSKNNSTNKDTVDFCTEKNVIRRVKELTVLFLNREYPGIIDSNLSFSGRDGAVLNELLNNNMKKAIIAQVKIEFKDCFKPKSATPPPPPPPPDPNPNSGDAGTYTVYNPGKDTVWCDEALVVKRIKELTFSILNKEYPGVVNKDLSFSGRDGAVINELLNENIKAEIIRQVNNEFKNCRFKSSSFDFLMPSGNSKKTNNKTTDTKVNSGGKDSKNTLKTSDNKSSNTKTTVTTSNTNTNTTVSGGNLQLKPVSSKPVYGVLLYENATYSKMTFYDLKDVKIYKGDDGIFRYYSGEFNTAADAYPHKVKIAAKGAQSAKVSLIKGQEVMQ